MRVSPAFRQVLRHLVHSVHIMTGPDPTALRQTGPKQDIFRAAANAVNRGDYGTLILDGLGQIRACGAAGEKILGAGEARLIGRRISEFIAGLFIDGSSPSYSARYLVYLCADGEWRKFEATDDAGHGFAVELSLSRMITDGQEIFLLNLRRPDQTVRPWL